MIRRFFTLLLALALLALPVAACVETPRCAESCQHACDVCDTECDADAITACENACEDGQTAPERTDCILETTSCDDLWKC
jgi:hypothetical protein